MLQNTEITRSSYLKFLTCFIRLQMMILEGTFIVSVITVTTVICRTVLGEVRSEEWTDLVMFYYE